MFKKYLNFFFITVLGITFLSGVLFFAFYKMWGLAAILFSFLYIIYLGAKENRIFYGFKNSIKEEIQKIDFSGQYNLIQESKKTNYLTLWHCDLDLKEKEIRYTKSDQKFFSIGQGISFKNILLENEPVRNDSLESKKVCIIETQFGSWKLRTLPSFIDAYLILKELVITYYLQDRCNISGFNFNLLYLDESGIVMLLELHQHMGYYGNYDFRLSRKKLEDLKPDKDLMLYIEHKKNYVKNEYGFVTKVNIF